MSISDVVVPGIACLFFIAVMFGAFYGLVYLARFISNLVGKVPDNPTKAIPPLTEGGYRGSMGSRPYPTRNKPVASPPMVTVKPPKKSCGGCCNCKCGVNNESH